jgi:hypothetical protein
MPPRGQLLFLILSGVLVVVVLMFALPSRVPTRVEGFFAPGDPPVLRAAAAAHADPNLCTVWPSGYAFESESLVAHPTSSAADPKCIVLRSGLGLLTSDDPKACVPQPDQPAVKWYNPLNAVATFGAKVAPDYVAGLDRCTIRFAKGASAADLRALDDAISLAGAELRAGLPVVQDRLGRTSAVLGGAGEQLGADSGELASATRQLDAVAAAIAAAKADQGRSEALAKAMAEADDAAMRQAASQFQSRVSAGQQAYAARLADQTGTDQRLLDIAAQQAQAAAAAQRKQCDATQAQLQQQASQAKSSLQAQLQQLQQQCQAQAQSLRTQAWQWQNQC